MIESLLEGLVLLESSVLVLFFTEICGLLCHFLIRLAVKLGGGKSMKIEGVVVFELVVAWLTATFG